MNDIVVRAVEFLNNLGIDDLKELAYSNNMSEYPEDHITRRFVDYAYGDNKKALGFITCLTSLYPYIAQELYNRLVGYLNDDKPYGIGGICN